MTDYTMCTNKKCPRYEECLQATEPPKQQPYSHFECSDGNDWKWFVFDENWIDKMIKRGRDK